MRTKATLPLLLLLASGCSEKAAPASPPPTPAATAPAPSQAAETWITYVCPGERIVQAQYPDRDSARLKIDGAIHSLKIAMSGSGARYVGEALQWWTKGSEGTLAPLKPGEDIASAAGVQCLPPAEAPVEPPKPGSPGGLPDDRTPLSERPAKPGGGQAAATVVETYFAYLEGGRPTEAAKLMTNGRADDFAPYVQIHAQVGAPGDVEGAAGSLFVDVPVVVYGRLADGTAFHKSGAATLRRVNDVPGATAEQLKWRIEKIDVR